MGAGLGVGVGVEDMNFEVNVMAVGQLTPLHLAASSGHERTCMVLVREGAATRVVSSSGDTPADFARDRGHYELAAHLALGRATAVARFRCPGPVSWARNRRRRQRIRLRMGMDMGVEGWRWVAKVVRIPTRKDGPARRGAGGGKVI